MRNTALLLSFLSVFFFFWTTFKRKPHYRDDTAPSYIASRMKHLERAGDQYDTLIIGPSYIRNGIDPRLFNEAASDAGYPLSAFKLAAHSMSMPESDFLIRNLPPRAKENLKLVIFEAHHFTWDVNSQNYFNERSLYWSDWRSLALTLRFTDWLRWDGRPGLKLTLVRALHTLGWFFRVGQGREWVASQFGLSESATLDQMHGTEGSPPGFVPENDFIGFRESMIKLWETTPAKNIEQCRRDLRRPEKGMLDYFERLRASFAERNVKVLFVMSPVLFPWMCPLPDGRDNSVPIVLFNNPKQYPQLFEWKGRLDKNHLNPEGAIAYSRELGKVAATFLGQANRLVGR